jgi:hypothetical protein
MGQAAAIPKVLQALVKGLRDESGTVMPCIAMLTRCAGLARSSAMEG